ncbi:uncharacterized protein LOC126898439 isoform X2 [Daktulosphaira vitifoliae]|uniref:uncharacterized protein LOC126898439 isoform X2 n=1 Tax=Daktulosphaira vitifoliae TaxID=58002 RepID=UPI0021A9F766|nr:uncharacterized protein LOC126898439 isoform X2 [Daktulosphaira vitifoliae]
MEFRQVISIAILLSSVPLQLLLLKYNREIIQFFSNVYQSLPDEFYLSDYIVDYIDPRAIFWSIFDYSDTIKDDNESEDENINSAEIHEFRPPHLRYRVGDVVVTLDVNLAIIVGWSIDKSDLTKEPRYFLLIEGNKKEVTFYDQNQLILLEGIKIIQRIILINNELQDSIPTKIRSVY